MYNSCVHRTTVSPAEGGEHGAEPGGGAGRSAGRHRGPEVAPPVGEHRRGGGGHPAGPGAGEQVLDQTQNQQGRSACLTSMHNFVHVGLIEVSCSVFTR